MKNEYDILKVFAILLVVIGHITAIYSPQSSFQDVAVSPVLTAVTRIIYIFHMPLFIALSGAIFEYGVNNGKYKEFKPFLINKVKRIIIPYFFVGIMFLIPTLVLINNVNFTSCIYDIYVRGGSDSKHLWYLGAIFWCFLFAWLIERFHINCYLAFAVSIGAVMVYSAFIKNNYFQIGNGVSASPSFLFGMIMTRYDIKRPVMSIITCFIVLMVLKIGIGMMPQPLVKQLCCLLLPYPIILVLYIIAKHWLSVLLKSSCMRFILKKSFPIYLLHVECIYLIYHYFRNAIEMYILIPITFAISIVVSVFLANIFQKCKVSFLIGEK